MNRYAAKLLFQFQVDADRQTRRQTFEERIVLVDAESATEAYRTAKRRGNDGKFRYQNNAGQTVKFKFVGVMDLLQLGPECETDEVWYDIIDRNWTPGLKKKLIPRRTKLAAFREERSRLSSTSTTRAKRARKS